MDITIDEAIEILEAELPAFTPDVTQNTINAHKLGIEALKFFKSHHKGLGLDNDPMLPGETKDIKRGMTETQFINPERD